MPRTFLPAVTVAAVIESEGRFLLVEEHTADGVRINQPAGHLEARESLHDAVVREVLEETAHVFVPAALIGVYLWRGEPWADGHLPPTYLRFAFCGTVHERIAGRALDDGIIRTLWMDESQMRATRDRHRSPLVMQCVEDYRRGQRVGLDLLFTHPGIFDSTGSSIGAAGAGLRE
ncbi:MAG TPA: NUDIX hydrolase [Burkholderiaceae bacterium]|nr:NUDIX hydrolase [Burkholderiaceae bacterium]